MDSILPGCVGVPYPQGAECASPLCVPRYDVGYADTDLPQWTVALQTALVG